MASVVLSDKKKYVNPSYRSGANPLWGKKKHSLLIDSQGASNKTIRTESGTLKFENGVAALPNDQRALDIAQEIQATHALHPNQYSLVQNKETVNVDRTHRMRIVSPGMPWATYDSLGRRVSDKENSCSVPLMDVNDYTMQEGFVKSIMMPTVAPVKPKDDK